MGVHGIQAIERAPCGRSIVCPQKLLAYTANMPSPKTVNEIILDEVMNGLAEAFEQTSIEFLYVLR